MSGFSEATLEKRLSELNDSQQSVQTLSLWLIHHRKHHAAIAKIWNREFIKTKDSRKLTFIYLVNDVVANCRKKGPEFKNEFGPILGGALKLMVQAVNDDTTQKKLERILGIWESRKMFEEKYLAEFKRVFDAHAKKRSDTGEPPAKVSKRDTLDSSKENKSASKVEADHGKKERKKSEGHEANQLDLKENNVMNESSIAASSPNFNTSEPPEPDVLIKAIQALENAASGDGKVREQIAQLPPEVSDVLLVNKISDPTEAESLRARVEDAVQLLANYNGRLLKEMEDRKSLTKMLHDFTASQKELLVQSEERLQDYKEKLAKVYQVREELRSHIQSLPDMSQLPDVSAVPLPSAGDLFNLR